MKYTEEQLPTGIIITKYKYPYVIAWLKTITPMRKIIMILAIMLCCVVAKGQILNYEEIVIKCNEAEYKLNNNTITEFYDTLHIWKSKLPISGYKIELYEKKDACYYYFDPEVQDSVSVNFESKNIDTECFDYSIIIKNKKYINSILDTLDKEKYLIVEKYRKDHFVRFYLYKNEYEDDFLSSSLIVDKVYCEDNFSFITTHLKF